MLKLRSKLVTADLGLPQTDRDLLILALKQLPALR